MSRIILAAVFLAAASFAQTPTTTAVAFSPDPATAGQLVTLTATVSPAATGTVEFLDGLRILGTATLNNGTAILPIRFTIPKTYHIRAVYAGNASFAASTSNPVPVPVSSVAAASFGPATTLPAKGQFMDMNGDGTPDLVTGSSGVSIATAPGVFGPVQSSLNLSVGTIADFSMDGKPDIVGTAAENIGLGLGNGAFTLSQTGITPGTFSQTAADFNRDGKPDVLGYVAPSVPFGGTTFRVFYGAGNGTFAASPSTLPGNFLPGDFDGDATADGIYFTGGGQGNPFSVCTISIDLAPGSGGCGGGPVGVQAFIADFSNDGLDDILTTQASSILLLVSKGDGTFHPWVTTTPASGYIYLQSLDWNNDGKLDVIVYRLTANNTIEFAYLPGSGNGSFGSEIAIPIVVPSAYFGFQFLELNGDGRMDLYVSDPQPIVFFGAGAASGGLSSRLVSVTPASGSGTSVSLTGKFRTGVNGNAQNPQITGSYILVSNTITGQNACLVEFTQSNRFRLLDDAGTTFLGPISGGSGLSLSNSQCTLRGAGSSVTSPVIEGSSVTYTGTADLQFTDGFAGAKNVYLLSIGVVGSNTGWEPFGVFTVTAGGGSPNQPGGQPAVSALQPLNGSGGTQVFTGTVTHSGGPLGHYLAYMLFLPTPNVVNFIAQGSCLVEYNRISNGMRLIDDAGTGWLGGLSGITVGQAGNVLTNASCSVDVATASAVFTGNTLTVNVPVAFAGSFGPQLGTFLQELDVNGLWTGMTQFGNWIVPTATTPPAGPVLISTTVQGPQTAPTITVVADGSSNTLPSQIHMRIAQTIIGTPVCHIVVSPSANVVGLVNETESGLASPGFVTIGVNQALSNSRCSVNAANVSKTTGASQATVGVPVTFGAFPGSKTLYINVFDDQGKLTHWRNMGTLTVP